MASGYVLLDANGADLRGDEDLAQQEESHQVVRHDATEQSQDKRSRSAAVMQLLLEFQAAASSVPAVMASKIIVERVLLVADCISDVLVGLALKMGSPTWGHAVLTLTLLPYICMACALANYMADRAASRWSIPRAIGKVMWVTVAIPTLILADVALILRYFCVNPTDAAVLHYLNLRRTVGVAEALTELSLQAYLMIELVRPRGELPLASGARVDRWLLCTSMALSAKTVYDVLRFALKYKRVQMNGSMLRFFRKMACLGEGLAPAVLYEQLERHRAVDIRFDLSGTSDTELARLARTARSSQVLRKLRISSALFLQEMDEAACESILRELLQATKLEALSLGAGISRERYEAVVRNVALTMFDEHPQLHIVEVEGFEPLRNHSPTALRLLVAKCRMDDLALVAQRVKDFKATVLSDPRVAVLMIIFSRTGFLADYISDVQVGRGLREKGNPIWGNTVLTLVLVPYIIMACALSGYAADRIAARVSAPRLVAKTLWFMVSLPVLLVADVSLTARYICSHPTDTARFHYLSLRKMAEVVEAVPQLWLQTYIGIRLWNPWRKLVPVTGASVNPGMLLISIALSAYTLYDIASFLKKFRRVQGHGSIRRFLGKMSRLGEGLAPSVLFEQLQKERSVDIHFDLRSASRAEVEALATTARASPVLQELRLSDTRFLQAMDEVYFTNVLGDALNARKLSSFSLGPGISPERYHLIRIVVRMLLDEHPTLQIVEVDGFAPLQRRSSSARSMAREELMQAMCASGAFEALRTLLLDATVGPQLMANQLLENGTLLTIAARWQQPSVVGLLLRALADPNAHEAQAVFEAVACNSTEALDRLLEARGEPNCQDEAGASPVWVAAQTNAVEALQQLLAVRGDPNLPNRNGGSPVHIAGQNNTAEAMEQLLAARGNPNQQNQEGASPVFIAAHKNSTEAVAQLLAVRGNPNLQDLNGFSPVLAAAHRNAAKAIEHLLMWRGDPNLQENHGASPVYVAAQSNANEALQQLLAARGEPNLQDHDGGSPVSMAAGRNAAEAVVQLLVARGDPNLQGQQGGSPVFMATQENASEALEHLLAARGDPSLARDDACTPAGIAAVCNAAEALQRLLAAGADPNLRGHQDEEDGDSPVCYAAYHNATEALQLLLAARGDPNQADHESRSPAFLAAQKNSIEALTMLLEARADATRRASNGLTALEAARAQGALRCQHVLEARLR